MSRRLVVAVLCGAVLTLAGCSQGAPASAPTSPVSGAPTTASAAAEAVTKEQWLATMGPDGVSAITSLLDEPGAQALLDVRNADGWSALLFATDAGDTDAVARLLEAGADPLERTLTGLPTVGAMHLAAANGDVEMLRVLLDHGVPVDTLDGAGGHALLWAAYKGQREAAQFLLDAGADPTIVDGSRMNAAQRAEGEDSPKSRR